MCRHTSRQESTGQWTNLAEKGAGYCCLIGPLSNDRQCLSIFISPAIGRVRPTFLFPYPKRLARPRLVRCWWVAQQPPKDACYRKEHPSYHQTQAEEIRCKKGRI